MKRLLIFATEFPPGPGGIGTHAYQLARHLHKLDWDVQVLTNQDYVHTDEIHAFNSHQTFKIQNLSKSRFSLIKIVFRILELLRIVRHFNPDVIVSSGERAVFLNAFLNLVYSKPWVAIRHGGTPLTKIQRLLTRWSYQRANLIIFVSQYTQQALDTLKVQTQRSIVITNGAEAEFFRPIDHNPVTQFKNELNLGSTPIILTVGNVTERKGQDIVIRSLPYILKNYGDVHYLMAGLPTMKQSMQKIAIELGVEKHIHFLGRLSKDRLLLAYNACDIFAMTSRHNQQGDFEGFGIAVIEAALCGKPAVVSDNSGLKEAIIDQKTGTIVKENDPLSTAQAIINLLNSEETRNRMGRAAQERAINSQTWEVSILQYHKALEELLDSTSNQVKNKKANIF